MKDAVPSSDVSQPSPSSQSDSSITSSARSSASASTSPPANGVVRDSSWLELEVCREFMRGSCMRSSAECRYVHPNGSLLVKDGKVTCCFDFLKDRCTRERCKYLHPPDEVKQRLVIAGKQYGQQMAFTTKPLLTTPYSAPMQAVPLPGGGFPLGLPFMAMGNGYGPVMPPYPPFASPPPSSIPMVNTQMMDVCRDHDNGGCNRGDLCRFAHPAIHVRRNPNNTVSVCWNYMMGYCRHQQCWFYHPPPPLGSPTFGCTNLGPVMTQPFVDSMMMSPLASPHPLSPSLSGMPSVPLTNGHIAASASLPSPVFMPTGPVLPPPAVAAAPMIPVSGPAGKKVFGVPCFFPPTTPISNAAPPLPNLISLSKDIILPTREN